MGQEHGAERTAARDKLEQLNERRPHRYPRAWVFATWEELWWRWTEELKIELRRMLREMQTENPTKEELRFYALAQGPRGTTNLVMPTTFQLDDPQAYYRSVVEPRIERAYDRVMWGNAWKGMEAPPQGWRTSLGRGIGRLSSGRVSGREGRARWRNPRQGQSQGARSL